MDLATVLIEEDPVWIPSILWQHQVEVQIIAPSKIWTPGMEKAYRASLTTIDGSVESINAILNENVTTESPSSEAQYLITMLSSVWNDLDKQRENLNLQIKRAETTYDSIKRFSANPPADPTHVSIRGKREVVGTIDTQGLIKSVSSTVKSSTLRQGATEAMLREIRDLLKGQRSISTESQPPQADQDALKLLSTHDKSQFRERSSVNNVAHGKFKGLNQNTNEDTNSLSSEHSDYVTNEKKTATKRQKKRIFCPFCETDVTNFARHVDRNHSHEPEVVAFAWRKKKDPERKRQLELLWKRGNFIQSSHGDVRPVRKMDLLNQLQAIDNEVESNVRTISVKELPLEEPFVIQDIRKVSTRFGQTVVARLKSRVTGSCEDVWLPRRYVETFIKTSFRSFYAPPARYIKHGTVSQFEGAFCEFYSVDDHVPLSSIAVKAQDDPFRNIKVSQRSLNPHVAESNSGTASPQRHESTSVSSPNLPNPVNSNGANASSLTPPLTSKKTKLRSSGKPVAPSGKMDLLNQLQAIDNEVESNVRTISVKELPLEEPFVIQDIRKVSTRFGQTVVARLKSRVTGSCEDVWLPRRYVETFIKSKEKYKVNSLSMMYHGIENSSNAFRLTFEMTPEDYNEADNEGAFCEFYSVDDHVPLSSIAVKAQDDPFRNIKVSQRSLNPRVAESNSGTASPQRHESTSVSSPNLPNPVNSNGANASSLTPPPTSKKTKLRSSGKPDAPSGKMDLLNQLQAIDNEVESNVRTISVKELPLEEPFVIQDIRKVSTRFGQTVVARLKSRVTGSCEDVWLPRRYVETFIKSKEKYKVNSLSMMYHGIENSSNAFRLTFEMTPEDYNEADNEGHPKMSFRKGSAQIMDTDLWKVSVSEYERESGLKELIDDAYNSAMGLEGSELDLLIMASAYQGFDPVRVMRTLCQKNIAAADASGHIVIASGFKLNKNAPLNVDVQHILMIFASRGTVYDKLAAKSTEEFKALVQHLVAKYNIDTNRHEPGTALSPELVTIPRVAAVFPAVMVNIFATGRGKTIFDLSLIGPNFAEHPVLASTYLASCMSVGAVKVNAAMHIPLFVVYMYSDRILHRKKGDYTAYDQMLSYYQAAFRSTAISETNRVVLCLRWGILAEHNPTTVAISKWFSECINEADLFVLTIPGMTAAEWAKIRKSLHELTN
ncbi:hypothetical protein GE061_015817 [Apolygus lucorum]|uniref:Uncharacterized protein n=1 Tax=Apolygus lucorum TaxID=248454 RepID=A0A8S9XP41_APOLU|nr:hypothetical protein GE061_015817 [Apolygus lucorum]